MIKVLRYILEVVVEMLEAVDLWLWSQRRATREQRKAIDEYYR